MGKAKIYGMNRQFAPNRDAGRLREKTCRKDEIISKYQRAPMPSIRLIQRKERDNA